VTATRRTTITTSPDSPLPAGCVLTYQSPHYYHRPCPSVPNNLQWFESTLCQIFVDRQLDESVKIHPSLTKPEHTYPFHIRQHIWTASTGKPVAYIWQPPTCNPWPTEGCYSLPGPKAGSLKNNKLSSSMPSLSGTGMNDDA